MELELKHIAPYLPYNVGCIIPLGYHRTLDAKILQVMIKENFFKCYLKLRPLSALTKEIEHNRERFVPIEILDMDFLQFEYFHSENGLDLSRVSYLDLIRLLSWHFDVFGLIHAGLAIEIKQ